MKRVLACLPASIALAGVIAACSGGSGDSPTETVVDRLPTCGSSTSLFTVAPIAPSNIMGWVPLGALNPPAHTFPTDHQYIYITNFSSGNTPVPVVAPGPITVTGARVVHYSTGSVGEDYALDFAACHEVSGSLGHVRTISAALLAALGPLDQQCSTYSPNPGLTVSNCFSRRVSIEVATGDVIGTSAGLDLSLFDTRVSPATFAAPSRWSKDASGFDHFHVVPFSDYYAEPARSVVRSMLGSFDGRTRRIAEPLGGTIASDLLGTAQGTWFSASEPTYPETPHLAIVPDNVDPSRIDVSVGMSQPGMAPGAYSFMPVTTGLVNRDPSTITSGASIYCWEIGYSASDRRGVLLVRLDDQITLTVDARAGASRTCNGELPWVITASAFTYKR